METSHLVYVTVGSLAEAREIAHRVIEERLAACANITEQITSIYPWEGEIEEASETLLLLKTSGARLAILVERIRALHSYELPCITALPIVGGNPAYLAWIAAETA